MEQKPHKERTGFAMDVWLAAAEIGRARGIGNGDASAAWRDFDEALDALVEQLEATREALRGVFVWVEVPDSSMGDADWRKREEAMREAQRVLTSNPTTNSTSTPQDATGVDFDPAKMPE